MICASNEVGLKDQQSYVASRNAPQAVQGSELLSTHTWRASLPHSTAQYFGSQYCTDTHSGQGERKRQRERGAEKGRQMDILRASAVGLRICDQHGKNPAVESNREFERECPKTFFPS